MPLHEPIVPNPRLQRVRELGGKSGELLVSSAPEAVQAVSADVAGAMLAAVNAALAAFGGEPRCGWGLAFGAAVGRLATLCCLAGLRPPTPRPP